MFEPRRLTVEEAQWRISCGWYVDCSAITYEPLLLLVDQIEGGTSKESLRAIQNQSQFLLL